MQQQLIHGLHPCDALGLGRVADEIDHPHAWYEGLFSSVKTEQQRYCDEQASYDLAAEEHVRYLLTNPDPQLAHIESLRLQQRKTDTSHLKRRAILSTYALEHLLQSRLFSIAQQLLEHSRAVKNRSPSPFEASTDWEDWFVQHRVSVFQAQAPHREDQRQLIDLIERVRATWSFLSQQEPEAEPGNQIQRENGQTA